MTEAEWSPQRKPKIFTLWPFTEKVRQHLLKTPRRAGVTQHLGHPIPRPSSHRVGKGLRLQWGGVRARSCCAAFEGHLGQAGRCGPGSPGPFSGRDLKGPLEAAFTLPLAGREGRGWGWAEETLGSPSRRGSEIGRASCRERVSSPV